MGDSRRKPWCPKGFALETNRSDGSLGAGILPHALPFTRRQLQDPPRRMRRERSMTSRRWTNGLICRCLQV